jgi:enoyl-CoA hydratase/carnithine racemase
MRVAVEVDGHVLLIGIDRPEKRNAFDLATIDSCRPVVRQNRVRRLRRG